jgi:flagellar hook-length control protein FliK
MRGDFKPKNPADDNTEAPHQALQNLTAGTAEIRSGKSEPLAAPELQESAEARDTEILGQVSAGIARGLEEGEKEFVVRLKPEGLGEITVLMAQKGGKVVLNIVASSAQTEKLISGEAAGLRESLRAYNAELQQVTSTETNPDAYSYLTGQDAQTGSGERFNQWQDAERQTGNGAYGFDGTADTAAEEPADRGIPQTTSLLNRYI